MEISFSHTVAYTTIHHIFQIPKQHCYFAKSKWLLWFFTFQYSFIKCCFFFDIVAGSVVIIAADFHSIFICFYYFVSVEMEHESRIKWEYWWANLNKSVFMMWAHLHFDRGTMKIYHLSFFESQQLRVSRTHKHIHTTYIFRRTHDNTYHGVSLFYKVHSAETFLDSVFFLCSLSISPV